MKFKLTKNTKSWYGTTLFQIEATVNFGSVLKGDLGGWVEKEGNLSQYDTAWVSGDARVFGGARVSDNAQVFGGARVFGDARVFGGAQVSAKASFTKGWFIGGDNTGKITDITDKTGSDYWKNQYVLGDYEITPLEGTETIKIGDKTYDKNEIEKALKNIKAINQ